DRQPQQVLQGGPAGAEIVEPDLEADVPQTVHDADGTASVQSRRLGDLQVDGGGRSTADGGGDGGDAVLVLEVTARQVQAQPQLRPIALPADQLPGRLGDDQQIQIDDE